MERIQKILAEIESERKRQNEQEGYDEDHDDEHDAGILADAGSCYAAFACEKKPKPPAWWPWDGRFWHPKNPRKDLVRAAALIVAEIERHDRIYLEHFGVEPVSS